MKRASIALLILIAAILLARPLIAWFTGKPMGGSTSEGEIAKAGDLTLEAAVRPDPPRQSGNTLVVKLTGPDQKPLEDADVEVEYVMPAMGAMAEMRGNADVDEKDDGRYHASFDLPMTGTWTLEVRVKSKAASGSARYTMTVGSKGLVATGAEGGARTAALPPQQYPPVADAHTHGEDEAAYYTCSMHPSVKQDRPGTCPICSMNLVPVSKAEVSSGIIRVDEERRQKIGVRTETVIVRPISTAIRAVGQTKYDESRVRDITLKLDGFIERLYVDKTGQFVRRGQPLLALYSPDLYAAQQEYLLALNSQSASRSTAVPDRADYLVRAARQRLRLWDFSDAQINQVARNGRPIERMPVLSPYSGFVIEKNVVEGSAVKAGERVFRVAALDQIWIEADVYEKDLALVRPGQVARVTLPYIPGRSFTARITYVYPYLDPATRTGKVRLELPNPNGELKPEMYADVELQIPGGSRVMVPESAVIQTGPRQLVFLDLGEGRLRPQQVQLGRKAEGYYEVLSGLREGDRVISSANFLIASESRIRSAEQFWGGSDEANQ